ncbi:hypothetical protein [Georgenia sp. SYP-B2076]|uniref:hypothetical protein n=1 Tax=Georgenia sp. SYP-B2076 TaxID=2495881 RepID=UPI000F8DD67B|nr:hypothetical protein [Georgenia sp. SYP-B2076]
MSQHTTNAAAPAPADDPYRCEHCDDSVPHKHLDVRAVVDAAREGARRHALWMLVVAGVLAAAALTAGVAAAGAPAAIGALATTVGGWLVATAVAVMVVGLARARTSDTRALVLGSLASAALLPLVALAVALVVGGWVGAVVAGAAWLLCGAVAEGVRARSWRALLLAPGDAGEHARGAAVAQRRPAGVPELARWLVQGALVAVCAGLTALLPVVVVVLVPLSMVLAVGAAQQAVRRQTVRPAGA